MGATAGFACTPTELLYLANLREGKAIFGLEDPMRGFSEAQVEYAFEQARYTLAQRSFLVVEHDGTVVLDEDMVRLVDTVAKPRRTLLAFMALGSAVSAAERGVRRVFHVRGSSIVEISQSSGEVRLDPLADRVSIADAVLRFWETRDQPAANGRTVLVPQQAMHVAGQLAAQGGAGACEEHLLGLGVEEVTATALAATLASPIRNSALLAFDINGPPGRTLGMGMLEGTNGLWRLRPVPHESVPQVEISPCAGPALASLVRDFVRNVTAS